MVISTANLQTAQERAAPAAALKSSSSLFAKIRDVFQRCCLGLSNDTLAMAGSLNVTTSGALEVTSAVNLTSEPSDAQTGAFAVGGGANGLLFAIQNIFKGVFFAKEGAETGNSTRLGIGAARVVRGSLDTLRNAANISRGAVTLSSNAQNLQGVLSKVAIGAAAGSAVTGLIVCATGIALAKEVMTEAEHFETILEVKAHGPYEAVPKQSNKQAAYDHLQNKLKIEDQDIDRLKKEITGESKGVLSSVARFAKEGLRYVFGSPKTEFALLCRDVIRGKVKLEDVKEKLKALKEKIENTLVQQEIDARLNDVAGTLLGDFNGLYLKIETEQLQENKLKLFDRVFGQEVRELLQSEHEDKAKVVAIAQANVKLNKRLFIALGVIAAIGTIVSLAFSVCDYLGTFSAMPIMKIVETSVLLVSTILMLGVDIAFFLQSTSGKTDLANKLSGIGTLMLSWATQSALLITFKLSMIKTEVLVPLGLISAGLMYLISKVCQTETEKKPFDKDSGIGDSTDESQPLVPNPE